jgi:hypothetical protein
MSLHEDSLDKITIEQKKEIKRWLDFYKHAQNFEPIVMVKIIRFYACLTGFNSFNLSNFNFFHREDVREAYVAAYDFLIPTVESGQSKEELITFVNKQISLGLEKINSLRKKKHEKALKEIKISKINPFKKLISKINIHNDNSPFNNEDLTILILSFFISSIVSPCFFNK